MYIMRPEGDFTVLPLDAISHIFTFVPTHVWFGCIKCNTTLRGYFPWSVADMWITINSLDDRDNCENYFRIFYQGSLKKDRYVDVVKFTGFSIKRYKNDNQSLLVRLAIDNVDTFAMNSDGFESVHDYIRNNNFDDAEETVIAWSKTWHPNCSDYKYTLKCTLEEFVNLGAIGAGEFVKDILRGVFGPGDDMIIKKYLLEFICV